MKRLGLTSLLGLLWVGQLWSAQLARPAAKTSGRYLLVVETSSAMQRRAGAVQEAMRAMLSYDLNGQLHRGDTLGIWTFNQELYAGRFPLEVWTPELRESFSGNVMEFLKKQRYEKQTRLDGMFPELERLMKGSENLTVLLISAGDQEIRGTPFDRQINSAYAQWRSEMQQTRMPFITVLRARNGQFLSYTVNTAPWPVDFPAFPPIQPPPHAAKPPPETPVKKTAPAPPPEPRAPLILDMSKSAKAEVTKTAGAEAPPAGQSLTPAPAVVVQATPAPKIERVEALQPAPAPAPISKPPEALPAVAIAPTAAQTVAPPPAPLVPGETPKSDVAQAPQATVATPAAQPPPAARPAEAQTPPPSAPVPSISVAAPKAEAPQPVLPPSAKVEMPASPVAKSVPTRSQPSPAPQPEPISRIQPAVAAPPPKSEVKPAVAPAEVRNFAASPSDAGVAIPSQEAAAASPPTTAAQTAMTTPPTAVSPRKVLLIGAIALLPMVAGLWLLFLRRTRAAARASLITRSMDRKEK